MNMGPLDILIAEDDPSHATAIRRSLEKTYPDATISAVTSIREYREHIASTIPSIAILDLNLSDGCSIELLNITAGEALFPTIIMTSFGSEKVAVDMIKRGALD